MPPRKLTPTQQAQVCEWLCAGRDNGEVVAELAAQDLEVTRQCVDYYRGKFAAEIDAAEEQAMEAAKRTGWALRSKRVRALCTFLDKCYVDVEANPAGPLIRAGIPKELRETLAELRKELGQEAPARLEHSGPGGAAIEVAATHDISDGLTTPERLASVARILGSLGLLTAGGPGGAEDGAETAHD